MVDKLFEDNDLLDAKSYDTRIAEAVGVEADENYLAQNSFKKRLTEAIEAGGGSGGGATIVTPVATEEEGIFSVDLTPRSVLQAIETGKQVYLKQDTQDDGDTFYTYAKLVTFSRVPKRTEGLAERAAHFEAVFFTGTVPSVLETGQLDMDEKFTLYA